jgi:hypothetical protein
MQGLVSNTEIKLSNNEYAGKAFAIANAMIQCRKELWNEKGGQK